MIDITTENFETEVIRASMSVPVLVDFWAPWCGPCKSLSPILEKLEVAYEGRFVLAKINSDEQQELAGAFGIRSIPTCILMMGGKPVDGFMGALPEGKLREFLDKHLPVASGIGGGSADAAAALRLLARLWGVDPGAERLAALAAALGADVPVCLAGVPARMQGIGEILSPLPPLPPLGMVLVNPGVAVATPAVFKARSGDFSSPAVLPEGWRDAAALADWLRGTRNDLQAPALTLAPENAAASRPSPRASCKGSRPLPARTRCASAKRAGRSIWNGREGSTAP